MACPKGLISHGEQITLCSSRSLLFPYSLFDRTLSYSGTILGEIAGFTQILRAVEVTATGNRMEQQMLEMPSDDLCKTDRNKLIHCENINTNHC